MQNEMYRDFYKRILDKVQSNIYITDIDTDEIVYMNDYMKEAFHLNGVEGRVCWEVLQAGMKQRCEFCKVEELRKSEPGTCFTWREKNTVTGREYINYDSLEQMGNHTYHVQNSVDITEQLQLSMEATIDDLTGVLNRNAGKKHLGKTLKELKKGDKFTVALCDINGLNGLMIPMGIWKGTVFCSLSHGRYRAGWKSLILYSG